MNYFRLDVFARLAGLALTVCAWPAAASDIGPFRVGMTFDEARAVAPKAKWTETLSRYTQKVLELEGRNAFKLDGMTFHVNLKPLPYGAYDLAAFHTVERSARRSECEAAFGLTIRALEPRFGPLGPVTPLSEAERGRLPIGYDMLPVLFDRHEPVAMGGQSRVEVFQAGATGNTRWLSGRREGDLTVIVAGRYIDRDAALWPTSCVVTARIISTPPRPATEWVDVASLRAPPEPPRGARLLSFRGLATLPSAPTNVEVTCQVSRQTARLSACKAAPGVAEPLAVPAARQANGLRLDAPGIDPDSDIPLEAKLTVRIDPADAVAPSPPAGQATLSIADVAWAQRPTPADLQRYYPVRALRMEIAARVTMICEIGAGGALSCTSTLVQTAEGQEEMFVDWAAKVEQLFRAGPTLVDGSPATGRWVTLVFNLAPA